MTSAINLALMKIARRAEINEASKLVETFVDVGPLFSLLSGDDHQIIYGRRGTGKTHVLNYLADTKSKLGHPVAYIDMSQIGSSSGIYWDVSIPLAQRATHLLYDTLGALHDALLDFFLSILMIMIGP